jgi:hypothetical protein
LVVNGPKPPPYPLAADEPRAEEQRASFARVAAEAGLEASFVPIVEARDWPPDGQRAPCGPSGTLTVTGTLNWSEAALGWVGTWHACWKRRRHDWSIQGVGYDAAFANLVQGAALLASAHRPPEQVR